MASPRRPHPAARRPSAALTLRALTLRALTLRAVTLGLLALGALTQGCAGYTSALGYRARQAVLRGDVEVFDVLMAEAATTTPAGPRDDPLKTVLTHFLDLAADHRFSSRVDAWRTRGWVHDDMVCSIHRALHRELHTRDPVTARRSAQLCVETARAAALVPERRWQLADCLEGASFLTATSTEALVPFLAIAADPTEPLALRAALLDGLTHLPLASPERRRSNDATLSREDAERAAQADVARVGARLSWILRAVRGSTSLELVASGTAIGALELEETAVALQRSWLTRLAKSDDPDEAELPWSWVRALKARAKLADLATLGIWSREPAADTWWYACAEPRGPAPAGSAEAALGPALRVDVVTVGASAPIDLAARCAIAGLPRALLAGPAPLEVSARGAVGDVLEAANVAPPGTRLAITRKRRLDP